MPGRCWLILAVVGCGDETPGPSAEDFALAADGLTSIDGEAVVVDAIELTLSGDFSFVPSPNEDIDPLANTIAAADAASEVAADLLPGCITSTTGSVIVTHTLDCMVNGRTVTGTVTSTWRIDDTLHVDHQARDLQIDGRTVDLIASVSGFRSGMLETRLRDLTLSTATDAGGTLVLAGFWGATLDTSTGCGTKDGATSAAFDGAVFSRRDLGLAWCGDGIVDTLTAGRVELVRGTTAVTVEFLGDDQVVLDGDNYRVDATVTELRD